MYGGIQGLYDFGPLGTALKRRIEDAWAAWFVGLSGDYHLVDPAEILPEAVVRASGHLENFTDPEVTCSHCGAAFRADTVLEKQRPEGLDGCSPAQIGELLVQFHVNCPTCGQADAVRSQTVQYDVRPGFRRYRTGARLSPPGDGAGKLPFVPSDVGRGTSGLTSRHCGHW